MIFYVKSERKNENSCTLYDSRTHVNQVFDNYSAPRILLQDWLNMNLNLKVISICEITHGSKECVAWLKSSDQ